jgi:hypothetical protein
VYNQLDVESMEYGQIQILMGKPVCVYCRAAESVEKEHVFPRSWYPESTPSNVQRLTVPACRSCNERFKRAEEDFAQAVVMGLDSTRPEAAGVYERLSGSWKPSRAMPGRDFRHRVSRRQSILRNAVWSDPLPGATTMLVRTPSGLVVRAAPTSPLDQGVVNLVVEKLVRGLCYQETGAALGPLRIEATIVTKQFVHEGGNELQQFFVQIASMPMDKRLGPGLWFGRHELGAAG